MKSKSLLSTLVMLGSLSSFTTFGAGAVTASAATGGTLNVGLSADPPKLDPSLSSALVDRQVMINMYDTLFQLSPKNTVVPDLVKSYTVSSDNLTYTLHLRTGVKFQDGTDFDAAAVKFNLERDQLSISPRHSSLSGITSIDTPDASTVVLHLQTPFSPLLNILAGRSGMMVSPTAVNKEGAGFLNDPVGTGPFMFSERVKGDHITLVRNPHYWGKAPTFSKVVYTIFTDPNVELANLQSGAVQIVDTLPPSQVTSMTSNSQYVVVNKPSLGYQGFYLNVKAAPFTNKYLREAINAAIDRKILVNVVFRNAAVPGYSPFGPASPAYVKKTDTPPAPKAALVRKLLAKGGQPKGFQFTFKTAADPVAVQMAQVIQSMLSHYGIQMKIQPWEFGTLLADSANGSFQALALGWSGRLDPDQDIYQFFVTGGSLNSSQYSNAKVDGLLNQARVTSSMSGRAKTYASVMNILHQDAPYVFLYHQNNLIAYNKNLKGFVYYADGLIRVANLS